MTKAVLATFGTLGDILPFIATAIALEERRIEATIAAPDTHRQAIESEGLRHVRIRPSDDDIAEALGVDVTGAFRIMLRNPHYILDQIYLRSLRKTYQDVLDACKGADVLIVHSLLVGASQAAEKLGLPAARIALAPLHLQSAIYPPVTPGAPYRIEPRGHAALAYMRRVS